MRVIQRPYAAGGRVAALGTFDGVHLGHKALLNTAKSVATGYAVPLRVCTFNRHPLDVIRPGSSPDQLSTIPEKAMLMAGIGVDEMELMNFDRTMAAMEPADFLERLRKSMKLRAVVAGWNYTFGRNGSGDADMLRADGQLHGYDVIIVPPVRMDNGIIISSSLARQKLREGNMECTAELLGYSYALTGTVSQGKQKGHELGFPTANIEPWHRKALPRYGVYTCLLETGTEILSAVVNIGNQPTMPSGKVTVEVHALCGTPELYGQKVRISLMHLLREEKKFDSAEQLKEQIRYDCHEALKYFDMA